MEKPMLVVFDADAVRRRLVAWAEPREAVRAILVTGSRGRGAADRLSDFDIVVAVRDIAPFVEHGWLSEIGEPLAVYWDPPAEIVRNVALFADGLRADFTVCTPAQVEAMADELDNGYQVWLDRDGLAARLPEPTFRAFVPAPPTREAYLLAIEEFFSDVPYVAKHLWRDELLPARWCLECDMKDKYLRPLLEWRMECDHGWSVPLAPLGRGLKGRLPAYIWEQWEATCASASVEAHWDAFLATLSLYIRVAREVGERLGFAFPDRMAERAMEHARAVRALPVDTVDNSVETVDNFGR